VGFELTFGCPFFFVALFLLLHCTFTSHCAEWMRTHLAFCCCCLLFNCVLAAAWPRVCLCACAGGLDAVLQLL
jgi:hypothetical protein